MSFSRILQRCFCTSTQPSTTTSQSIKAILTDLYKERNLERLVEKFKKSSELHRFRKKIRIYEDAVRRLAAAKRFKWIEEILEDQKKYPEFTNEGFAVRLLSLYGKAGMLENAQKVFDEMPDKNCKRTLLSFNALLAACINSKKFDKVDEVFRAVTQKLSIEPDVVSYNTMIKAFCEMGSLDSAVSVLGEIEKKGLEPDAITYNTILYGLYANSRFSDAEKLWGQMVEKNVVPDVRSYNAKLQGLASEKRTEEGVELFEELRNKGIKPDVFSFNALIKGFVDEGKLEEAKQWYREMGKSSCAPQKWTFQTLIPFVCEKGDLDFAIELGEEIFKRRLLVDSALLQIVVDELVKASRVEEAKKLAELGKSNSYRRYNLKLPTEE